MPNQEIVVGLAVVASFVTVIILLCCFCDCGSAMGEFADEYNSMYIFDDDDKKESETPETVEKEKAL